MNNAAKMLNALRCGLLLLLAQPVFGATFYVSPVGEDSNPGTEQLPWKTVQKAATSMSAGDTVLIGPGTYPEDVYTVRSGLPGKPITFKANRDAKIREFRFKQHQWITLDGLWIQGNLGATGSHIRVEDNAHNSRIENCVIGPGVYVYGTGMVFDPVTETLSNETVNWTELGFKPGATIYTGGSSLTNYYYANHDKTWTITEVEGSAMRLAGNWTAETNSSAWAPVFAGLNYEGVSGVSLVYGRDQGPTNIVISGNLFTNLWGPGVVMSSGVGNVVANNTFENLNGYAWVKPNGTNIFIYSNLVLNCTNFVHYSAAEMSQFYHPMGAGWYDYQTGFLHATGKGENIHVFRNWLENVHNPLSQIAYKFNGWLGSGFYIRSNVFVGIGAEGSAGRNNLFIEQNTFFRVGYDYGRSGALALGGSEATPVTNVYVLRNVFVDSGDHSRTNIESHYWLLYVRNAVNNSNFIASAETLGFQGYRDFAEADGINGGDPMFVDPDNPRGPDQIPFTHDDGLRPMPNSPFASLGLGALPPLELVQGRPLAHFHVHATGWQTGARRGEEENWEQSEFYLRPNKIRPYPTPEALGSAPVKVTFDASKSISGTASTSDWAGITEFAWDFGDGETARTTTPIVEHTFTESGSFPVRLTVLNSGAATDSVVKTYYVSGDRNGAPSTPSGLRIVVQ